jgi:hypothetical protein
VNNHDSAIFTYCVAPTRSATPNYNRQISCEGAALSEASINRDIFSVGLLRCAAAHIR